MSNKFAIVTGGASGIGKSVSELLISKGIQVFAIDIRPFIMDRAICMTCDVSSEQDIINMIQQVHTYTEKVDYVVLPAGILCTGARFYLKELPIKEWNAVLNVNLTGTMLSLKHIIPLMNENGSIVTYSSDQVVRPIEKSAPYLVSKVGIEALTRLAALEFQRAKIRINCIRAAAVDTEFLSTLVNDPQIRREMRDNMDKLMPYGIISSREIAEITWFLLSEKASKITGQVITVDSGMLL